MRFTSISLVTLFATTSLTTAIAATSVTPTHTASANRYTETRLVASNANYHAVSVDPKLINAWGIAIRPVGAGGHFWVTGQHTSFEYVGDVQQASDATLRTLHTDSLSHVTLPTGGEEQTATGVVFNDSKDQFVITQTPVTGLPITAPAKFLFASDGGIISAWTERKKSDGSFDRPLESISVIDQSKEGSQFFGLTLNASYTRLYAADFGKHPGIAVFNGQFKAENVTFDMPFDTNKNGKVDPGEYAPFNIQALKLPSGPEHIFVTYAKTQACPQEEVAKHTCKEGELFAGEEDTSHPGQGRLAEFTEDGKLVAVWNDGSKLSAPWGIAFAPSNFSAFPNHLLVANFGDGTIAAYNPDTHDFVDQLRNEKGEVLKIDKIWGILFGNGESLGDNNALYYAAGPKDETEGLFGSLRAIDHTN